MVFPQQKRAHTGGQHFPPARPGGVSPPRSATTLGGPLIISPPPRRLNISGAHHHIFPPPFCDTPGYTTMGPPRRGPKHFGSPQKSPRAPKKEPLISGGKTHKLFPPVAHIPPWGKNPPKKYMGDPPKKFMGEVLFPRFHQKEKPPLCGVFW